VSDGSKSHVWWQARGVSGADVALGDAAEQAEEKVDEVDE
jgi:hypothetical protein